MKSQSERHVRQEDERNVVCTNHQTGFSVDYNNYIFQLTFFHINCVSLCLFNWTGGFEVSSKTTVKCLSFDFMGHQVSSFTFPVNYVWDLIREGRKLFKDWWKTKGNEVKWSEVKWRRGSNKKKFFIKTTKCLPPSETLLCQPTITLFLLLNKE